MKVVTQAIVNKAQEKVAGAFNSFWTKIGGRFWHGEARSRDVYPYCVFNYINIDPQYMFAEDKLKEIMLQFSFYSSSDSSVEAEDTYDYFEALFNHSALTVSGYYSLLFEIEQIRLRRDPDNGAWICDADCKFSVEKTA